MNNVIRPKIINRGINIIVAAKVFAPPLPNTTTAPSQAIVRTNAAREM